MYKPYSKLSDSEKAKMNIKNEHILRDVTDDDLKCHKPEGALLALTVANLTEQLNKISEIGLYTILMKKDCEPEILFDNELSSHTNIRISTVVKVVFGISIAYKVCVKRINKGRKKHYV